MKDEFAQPVSGPAYSAIYRLLATVLFVLVLAQGGVALTSAAGSGQLRGALWIWIALAVAVLVITYALMLRARTTIDTRGIVQTGLVERRVEWHDIRAARVGGLPASRRLIVRSLDGRRFVFFGGTAELHAAFQRIGTQYSPHP